MSGSAKRLGVAVGLGETPRFIDDVADALVPYYDVETLRVRRVDLPVLSERVNRHLLRRDLARFLDCHDVVLFEWASDLLATATRMPHRSAIITRLHRYEMFTWLDLINWADVAKVILVSKAMARKFELRMPRHAERAVVIPEAIVMSRFGGEIADRKGTIGTLCNLISRKRVYELVLAFRELIADGGHYNLRIGGGPTRAEGDYDDALVSLVRRLGIGDLVTFDGVVTDTPTWLSSIDVFVSSSYSEGLQVALIEAMASGCICFSHWWEGADELLPPANLFFSDAELVSKIRALSTMSDEERLSGRLRMRALVSPRLDVVTVAGQFKSVIDQAAAR